jgi:Predicted hydrolases or acyltransferases (alpha/beta hydrolase superfamily)
MNYRILFLFSIWAISFTTCNTPVIQSSESFFMSFDKTHIAFTDEGQGKAVILIHGFISNGSSWSKTVLKKSLIDKGYRVIVPDLRGNGKSDRPPSKNAYKYNAEVKDLVALADYLKLESYIAIGYSRGSIVLAKLLTGEERISKAVLGGMGVDFTDPNWARRIAFADAFSGRSEPTDMTRGAIDYARSIDADLEVLRMLQDYQPVTSLEELRDISTDILVICGDEDKDNGDPEDLHKALPNSHLIIVKGDHNNTYKQENFSQTIIDYLST